MKKPIETVLKEISEEGPEYSLRKRRYGKHASEHFPKLIEVLKKSLEEHKRVIRFLELRLERGEPVEVWKIVTEHAIKELESALESASNVEVGE